MDISLRMHHLWSDCWNQCVALCTARADVESPTDACYIVWRKNLLSLQWDVWFDKLLQFKGHCIL